jgi:hypothetical protein
MRKRREEIVNDDVLWPSRLWGLDVCGVWRGVIAIRHGPTAPRQTNRRSRQFFP